MLPPNPLTYWIMRRQIGIPLTDEELKSEREAARQALEILEMYPKIIAASFVMALILTPVILWLIS